MSTPAEQESPAPEGELYDVVVIGYGPVGQALTTLLAERGHSVVVVERWPEIYPLPRAGHIDHEVMRILQALGVADTIEEDSWKLTGYELRDSAGDVLYSFEWGHEAFSGWYSDYSLFQPQLEGLLHDRASSYPQVRMLRGWQAEGITQTADEVEVLARHGEAADGNFIPGPAVDRLRGRYVVGCDGANSLVRQSFDIPATDLGFEADWLVVFAEPNDPNHKVDMPDVAQLLDPRRPTTAFRSSGKRFCRWEFMLMPGETAESMSAPEVAWGLIERWGLTPENSRLVRNTVFRFRCVVADEWQAGRAFVAGDAAHLMPPFLGQGMCSGLRDAKTLAWKLDLALRGIADERVLRTYTAERRPHVTSIVEASLRLGEIISVIDPEAARRRDEMLRAGDARPPAPMPDLVDGVLRRHADGTLRAPAGRLSIQARVRVGDRTARLDDVVGSGWTLITTGWDAGEDLPADAMAVLARLGAAIVRIDALGAGADAVAEDVEGAYGAWFGELGADAVLLRPDFYLFGAASGPEDLAAAVDDLRRQLFLEPAADGEPGGSVARVGLS